MIRKMDFDTSCYPFRELFCKLQRQYNLEGVHLLGGFENNGSVPGKDNHSDWHNKFYNNMRGSEFMNCYDEFMNIEMRHKIFNEPIVVQRYPTVRYATPNGKGVAAYHVDSDYNHPIEETNIWLPFTATFDTNTIRIESQPGKKDYIALELNYGQYIAFPGGLLSHGNEVNQTNQTRVSIDMRVIPLSKFKSRPELKGLAYGKPRTIEGPDAYYRVIAA